MSNKTNVVAQVSTFLVSRLKSGLRLFVQALVETRRREAERSIAHWRTVLGEYDQTTNQPEPRNQRHATVSLVEPSNIPSVLRSV